jgi:hypothetical protein
MLSIEVKNVFDVFLFLFVGVARSVAGARWLTIMAFPFLSA